MRAGSSTRRKSYAPAIGASAPRRNQPSPPRSSTWPSAVAALPPCEKPVTYTSRRSVRCCPL
ncbi:hypothetical protein [Dactylosporangium sp. NPDC050588]|uniref:hypothetical protein n=1 Tax=Dactylosporangium sp. NPDC050588 TaxID=3157211 RepID=UPI00340C0BD7